VALTRVLRSKGVLPVYAVGNEGPGTSRSPGSYREALSIGACGRDGAVPAFSSSQRFDRSMDPPVPDLVAPGVEVISARPRGGWQVMDGTSMAAPHVTGLAALLLQARPEASVDEIEKAILASCKRPKRATRAGEPGHAGRRAGARRSAVSPGAALFSRCLPSRGATLRRLQRSHW
jgi:subtilisin